MIRQLFIIGLLILVGSQLNAQKNSDSSSLRYDQFQQLVLKYHPIAKKAKLFPEIGKAVLMSAKGNFDPKLIGNINQKYFEQTNYYSQSGVGLKIDTKSPVSIYSGYDLNDGNYLNPENKNPESGLIYAGVSVSLLQGLLINESRAAVQKAELFSSMTEQEQQLLLNDLLYESGQSYWRWFLSFQKLSVYDNSYQLAKNRFQFIKESALLGDRPLYDTIESYIYLQNIELGYNQVKNEYKNNTLYLSLYLWDENQNQLTLNPSIHPPVWKDLSLVDSLLDVNILDENRIQMHPIVSLYENKIKQYEIDKRWYKEQFKPELNLKYNLLSQAIGTESISLNNYTWGLSFSMPILLRKARGEVQKTEAYIQQNKWELDFKFQSIKTKLSTLFNETSLAINQHETYQSMVDNLYRLVEGENELFKIGESSIFLVNSREQTYLNTELKWLENFTKIKLNYLKVQYEYGQLK